MGLLEGKLFTANVSSALKTQHAPAVTSLYYFYKLLFPQLYVFIKECSACTRFIKSFQILKSDNQMMLALAIMRSQFRN